MMSDVRSREEILFRFKQESGNLWLYLSKPEFSGEAAPLSGLADPASAAPGGTARAADLERLAEEIAAHRFPLLGTVVSTGPKIEWRRDYLHGISSPNRYFRYIPYLDFSRAGDHKIIWELNRHQHWVVLAQAYLVGGNKAYLEEILTQFDSWERDNPYLCGINWASALEVAFRALSWMRVWRLAGDVMPAGFRRRFLTGLYRHGRYLEQNLSLYFSPNTHLLGEAVALNALGVLFPEFDRAKEWERRGAQIVRAQLDAQVRADGSHFEQSTYYHVYALDMFLFHAALAGMPPEFRPRLERMAQYLADLQGPSGTLPFLGDDDGGRLFHPYGPRERFGQATLAGFAPAPCASRLYPDAGVAVMTAGSAHVLVDAGPFGPGSGGHSHSDTLSLVARLGPEEILIDPGTYTYVAEPRWRDWFRGSAAHNTIRIDGRDQAVPAGPFRWENHPVAKVGEWSTSPERDLLDASCLYAGFTHRRRVLFLKPDRVLVFDEVEGPPGEHLLEQFWHPGGRVAAVAPNVFRIGGSALLAIAPGPEIESGEGGEHGWRSPAPGVKVPAPFLRAWRRTALPARFAAVLDLSGADSAEIRLEMPASGWTLWYYPAAGPAVSAVFGPAGVRYSTTW
jgi:hypothetical protein